MDILDDLLILFAKWKLALPNATIGCMFGYCKPIIDNKIYRGTALLVRYSKKYLINTKEKLDKNRPNKSLRELMNIGELMNVVLGDGIRFKTQKSSHFQSQQKSYDNKHKYNGYNSLGFCTVTGKYIGFYPITGIGCDGHHWDGFVLDFLIFNNIDNILGWLEINSKPFKNDGTRIIFDRALGRGCITFTEGVVNYTTPSLVMNRKKKTFENNQSRVEATAIRWGIEKSFGNIGNVWNMFGSQSVPISNYYIPIFGLWLNEAAAICNHLNIGLVKMSDDRKKQIAVMKMKKEQEIYDDTNNNHYCDILESTKDEEILNTYWIKANKIEDIYNNSNYWTLEKLNELFLLSEEEYKLIGGGPYTCEMGKWYLYHSKFFIEIWYSKFEEYEKYLLIRKIKPRLTRDWDKNHGVIRGSTKNTLETTDDLQYIVQGQKWNSKFHSVLIGEKINSVINYTNWNISDRVLNIRYGCTCVHGSRTICADSHGICALRLIHELLKGKNIKKLDENLISKKKWEYVMDINFFKSYLKDLNIGQTQVYVNKFIQNKIEPTFSL